MYRTDHGTYAELQTFITIRLLSVRAQGEWDGNRCQRKEYSRQQHAIGMSGMARDDGMLPRQQHASGVSGK